MSDVASSGTNDGIVSVNIGTPREVEHNGRVLSTAIYKDPVQGRVRVGRLHLEGDGQADLTVHGGVHQAVYLYPSEHYAFWCDELDRALSPGMFGENLTTHGFLESDTCIGDRFRAGSAELVVTQPRLPCVKLGVRFDRPDMVRRFLASGRTGWYASVSREGHVAAGDELIRISTDDRRLRVADVVALYQTAGNEALVRRAAGHPGLPPRMRERFRKQLG